MILWGCSFTDFLIINSIASSSMRVATTSKQEQKAIHLEVAASLLAEAAADHSAPEAEAEDSVKKYIDCNSNSKNCTNDIGLLTSLDK